MSIKRYYYEHQKQEEAKREKEIEELFRRWREEEHIKKIARDEARKEAQNYIAQNKTEVEVEVNKKSFQALRDAFENLF